MGINVSYLLIGFVLYIPQHVEGAMHFTTKPKYDVITKFYTLQKRTLLYDNVGL